MEKIKSHFVFNRSQRNGILLLVFFISGYLVINYYVDFSKENLLDINSKEVIAIQKELDSLRTIDIAFKKPKVFPFNPNFLTDFKGYTLGMSTEEIDRLLAFRKENKWINSVEDFKKVTKVSDSLLNKISPYFKFPDWVTNPKLKNKYVKKRFKEKKFTQKIDLNLATQGQLEGVNGIGKAFSKRIIEYRNKLGGFTNDIQLYQVYGLDFQVANSILKEFTVKTPKEIIKMNLNSISASDIATIPSISFDLAKRIWEFRILNEGIKSFSELENIEGLTKRKLQGIQLYLKLE
ncbi:MAG: helix-hairpin-helix domain-containing protein [Flavobacteriaceae bacterium]|jgi:DNA uptake protein ComE-like DNA-binding protein|nr:helix-hairpin-helix domain-containing protein [Flavobacteriaceae bacterium]MBT3920782.1 helix-hairpin-helix domain-containing protein [Flavobacteriaceae bacterium]MBT6704408.1 helix-hairpin-helix domain-containing protein [Flavobacteriaceae bacterium]MBT7243605.1 helix-hairpin-helix domain-containing protein [Flavobacteriaceae bacterium]